MIIYEFNIHPDWCEAGSDFGKALSFVSEHLKRFEFEKGKVKLYLDDHEDEQESKVKFLRLIDKFEKNVFDHGDRYLYENRGHGRSFEHTFVMDGKLVRNYGDGLIGLQGPALLLVDCLDRVFRDFALELGAQEKQYPVLLPIEQMEKTGYLRTSPQYSMFVSNAREDMNCLSSLAKGVREEQVVGHLAGPRYVLSPAACFHCYMDMEGQMLEHPQVLTLRQHVFRHEGSLNWGQFGRLRDYQVREIVFVGSHEFVTAKREKLIDLTKRWVEQLELTARMAITFDPFVVPEMQRFKKIQLLEKSKIELQLSIDPERYMACTSFNLHGAAFSQPFGFNVRGDNETVTGCVGFGLERWVLAILSQFGTDTVNWPQVLRRMISHEEVTKYECN
jgi:seryl-tRNA synthetase